MSILETFYILFESDADNLKKGADEAFRTTDNLEKKLKSTDHVAEKLGTGFRGMAVAAAGVLASFLSAGAIITSVFNDINIADKLDDQAKLLGLTTEELSAWGDAASISGGSAEAFQGTISNLSASLAQLDATGKSRVKPFFDELGINLTGGNGKAKDTLSLLLELSDKFEKMDKQSIAGFGRKLGLDQGTILLLSQGRRGVEDIIREQKELGSITTKQSELANKYGDAWENVHHVFRTIGLGIAENLLPYFIKFADMIKDGFVYLREHENLLEALATTFKIVAAVITAYMLPALASMAVGVIAATWPFLLIAAALTAFVLVLEDLYAFMDGNPSLLGDFLKDYPKIELALRTMIELFKELWNVIKDPLGALKELGGRAAEFLIHGKQTILGAENNPLASQTSRSIAGQTISNKSTNVTIGEVKIETQATDAEGIQKGFGEGLKRQTSQALNNYDNGIAG